MRRKSVLAALRVLKRKGLVKLLSKGSNLTNLPSVYRVRPTAMDD